MSGTSLDGLDLAHCSFKKNSKWEYSINSVLDVKYPVNLIQKLKNPASLSGKDLQRLDIEFGEFVGESINKFLKTANFKTDLIASHGHTIFHEPSHGFTTQIGNGNVILSITGLPVVNDFRSYDVALGGEGAPLVPVGDRLLFPEFDFCLNLGGIANISFEQNKKRLAYDVVPFNILFNNLAEKLSKEYDDGGRLASKGRILEGLLEELNNLDYYKMDYPKSLDKSWIEDKIILIIDKHEASINDKLRTVSEHLSVQIFNAISGVATNSASKVLVTGGGAFNNFFIENLRNKLKPLASLVLPDENLIKFKEAMVFAFLGVLKMEGLTNILSSVTGASRDTCSGVIYSN